MRRTAAVFIALLALPASAEAKGFPASCHLEGTVYFSPPLTTFPGQGRAFARATGTCDGRRASYVAWTSGLASCGEGDMTGAGYLTLRHRRKVRFRLTEHRVGAAAQLRLSARRGSATGVAAASPEEDPVAIAQACAGAGVSSTRVTLDLSRDPAA